MAMPTAACPLMFDPLEHLYVLDGVPVPSVTQVLRFARYIPLFDDLYDLVERQALTAFEAIAQLERRMRYLLAARQRGQDVHALLQYMVEDDLDESSIDDRYLGYVRSARAYLEREVTDVYRAEFRVWSRRRHYAGTTDLLCLHGDGYLSIDDFKTGDPEDVGADVQLAGYHNAILEMVQEDAELAALLQSAPVVIKRRSLRLFKDGRTAEPTTYPDTYGDTARFLNALNLVHDHRRRPVPVFDWADVR